MTARAKFLFDVDFGAGTGTGTAPDPARQTVALAAHEAAVAAASQQGYRDGFAAAQAEARAAAQRSVAASLERIATGFTGLASGLTNIEARLEAEAVEVAVAVGRKLASALVDREPLAEITALVVDCFSHLTAAPHVVIRVNDAIYPEARERLENLVRGRGFDGRLVVLAEPEILPGDCRIEWADGGMVRGRAATEAAIEEAVARYVAARLGDPDGMRAGGSIDG